MEDKSLKEKVNEMYDSYNVGYKEPPKRNLFDKLTGKNKPEKKFKLKGKVRRGFKRRVKKNYVLVFYLRTNGTIQPYFAPVSNDMVYIKETGLYHEISAKYVMRYDKYPCVILPEWSLNPFEFFSPMKHYEATELESRKALPQKAIINAMKLAQLEVKNPIKGRALLFIIAGLAIAGYILYQFVMKKPT